MTPWQARMAVLGFVVLASAICANLLLFQGERIATASVPRPKPVRTGAHPPAPVPRAAIPLPVRPAPRSPAPASGNR